MYDQNHVYALDIETDNSQGFGLDPTKAAITEIAFVTETKREVFQGPEADIIVALSDALRAEEPGLVVDWNGAFFDQPFIHTRATLLGLDDVVEAQFLIPQPGLQPKYDYLPGYTTAVSAQWNGRGGIEHAHLDISFAYKAFAASFGTHEVDGKTRPVVPHSLKPVLRAKGYDPVEIDRTRLHEYTPEQVAEYALSDAVGARELALDVLGAR